MTELIQTERLTLRPWRIEDAEAAVAIYGDRQIARWLSPAMGHVPDVAAMRLILQGWLRVGQELVSPAGRWAIELRDGSVVGGAVLLPLPPGAEDLELGWQLRRDAWGQGYAVEAGRAVARWAFGQHVEEVFAVVRPGNERAKATVRRLGMEWVGETDKYYDLRLQVFRLRQADLV